MVNSICGIYCIYNIAYYNRGVTAGEAKSKVGTATADKVLSGYTFTNAAGVGIAGTMVNRGTLNWNPTSNTTQTIQPGYYSGGTLNSAGAYNAGVAKGAADSRVGTATADKVLSGYTFTNSAGAGIAGTMVNRGTLNWNPTSSTTQTIQPGYYSGGTLNSSGAYQDGFNKGKEQSIKNLYGKSTSTSSVIQGKSIDVLRVQFEHGSWAEGSDSFSFDSGNINIFQTPNGKKSSPYFHNFYSSE